MGQRVLQCLDQAQLLRNGVGEDGGHVTYDAAVERDGQGVQGGGMWDMGSMPKEARRGGMGASDSGDG